MAARAIWKAVIRTGDRGVPIKLYSAVEDRSIHFRLLHEEDLVPVKQHMVNPETGERVDHSDTRRAIAGESGDLVILESDELEELEPEASRDVQIDRFVAPEAVEHAWYDRPYYLGPDGSTNGYFALVEALLGSGRVGIAHWVMRNKEYHGVLRPAGDHLMLITLHSAQEMVPVGALQAPGGRDLDEKELKMAEQLLDALTEEFDPGAYEDTHRSRVMELISAKEAGDVVEFRRPEEKRETGEDLSEALRASIREAKEARSA